jgi:hypothetical protein
VVNENVVDLPIASAAFQHINDGELISLLVNHGGIDFSIVFTQRLPAEDDPLAVIGSYPAKINFTEKVSEEWDKFLSLFRRKSPPV